MSEPTIKPELMRISWGPQHPMSGQTRILLDTDGEKVHKIIADLGFTHRGIEKVLENRSLMGGIIPIDTYGDGRHRQHQYRLCYSGGESPRYSGP